MLRPFHAAASRFRIASRRDVPGAVAAMIGSLRGRLLEAGEEQAIIDVGGVGYRVTVPASTRWALPSPGEETFLWVHTHVREQVIALFGFAGRDELQLFEE